MMKSLIITAVIGFVSLGASGVNVVVEQCTDLEQCETGCRVLHDAITSEECFHGVVYTCSGDEVIWDTYSSPDCAGNVSSSNNFTVNQCTAGTRVRCETPVNPTPTPTPDPIDYSYVDVEQCTDIKECKSGCRKAQSLSIGDCYQGTRYTCSSDGVTMFSYYYPDCTGGAMSSQEYTADQCVAGTKLRCQSDFGSKVMVNQCMDTTQCSDCRRLHDSLPSGDCIEGTKYICGNDNVFLLTYASPDCTGQAISTAEYSPFQCVAGMQMWCPAGMVAVSLPLLLLCGLISMFL